MRAEEAQKFAEDFEAKEADKVLASVYPVIEERSKKGITNCYIKVANSFNTVKLIAFILRGKHYSVEIAEESDGINISWAKKK